jgi:integrase
MKQRLRDPSFPPALAGWVIVGDRVLPRYWATISADILNAGMGDGTRSAYLSHIDRLYRSTEASPGSPDLDGLLARADFEGIQASLTSFLVTLRNRSAIDGGDKNAAWQAAVGFVSGILDHIAPASSHEAKSMLTRVAALRAKYAQLSPPPSKVAKPLRALPVEVVEELHEIFDPGSPRNPFRTPAQRARNQLLFLLLLHLGLRKGETLILPANAVKDDVDPRTGEVRLWVNVTTLEDGGERQVGQSKPGQEPSPSPAARGETRSAAPSIKTEHSHRRLPLPEVLAFAIDAYVGNYRGKPSHPFLFNSAKEFALAPQTVGDVFVTVSAKLSDRSRRLLKERRKHGISPHDLRHTAAVMRLAHYVSAGHSLDVAIGKLRPFFGWSPTSNEPLRYARAYFETEAADVREEVFDQHVATLRRLGGSNYGI